MKSTVAMILAGGRGKRMDIFCHQRPKPTLPFAGQFHVIDFTLSNCIHSDITHIAALVDHQRNVMTEYLEGWNSVNQGKGSLSILQPAVTSYTGTADAVYQNLTYPKTQGADRVLVLAGDHIYKMDYRKMLAFHEESEADVTVGVVRVPMQQANRFGTCITGTENRIGEFEEKTETPKSNLASMGIYVFNRDFLEKRLTEDANIAVSAHDFGYSILPRIVKQDRVFAYEFSGYWQDIGTVEAYYEANLQLLDKNPVFSIDSDWPILSGSESLPLSTANHRGKVVNSLVGPGCVIEGYVENSILSPGVHVAALARVTNSVIMANTQVGFHSIVDRSILDEGVSIGKFCYVGFGKSSKTEDCGITMVGKGVNVASQTAIGRKSKILPGLRLAELSSRFVPPGTVVAVPG